VTCESVRVEFEYVPQKAVVDLVQIRLILSNDWHVRIGVKDFQVTAQKVTYLVIKKKFQGGFDEDIGNGEPM